MKTERKFDVTSQLIIQKSESLITIEVEFNTLILDEDKPLECPFWAFVGFINEKEDKVYCIQNNGVVDTDTFKYQLVERDSNQELSMDELHVTQFIMAECKTIEIDANGTGKAIIYLREFYLGEFEGDNMPVANIFLRSKNNL